MDPERWRRAFTLFQATIAHDAEQRAAFLGAACPGNEDIRDAVEQLLRADASAGDFLEVPAAIRLIADADASSAIAPRADLLDATIATAAFAGTERFTVRRCLGAGG